MSTFYIKEDGEPKTVGDLKRILDERNVPDDAELRITLENDGRDYSDIVGGYGWNEEVFILSGLSEMK